MRSEKKKTKMKNRQGKKKKVYTHTHTLTFLVRRLASAAQLPASTSFVSFCVFLDLFINIYQLLRLLFLRLRNRSFSFFYFFFRVWYKTTPTKTLVLLGIDTVNISRCFQRLLFFLFLFFVLSLSLSSLWARYPANVFPVLCAQLSRITFYTPIYCPTAVDTLQPIIELQQQSFLRMGAPRTRFYVFDGSNLIDFLNVKSCPVKKKKIGSKYCMSFTSSSSSPLPNTHTQKK